MNLSAKNALMDLGSVLKHSLMNPDTHPAHPEVAIMSDSIATTVSRDVSCKGTLFGRHKKWTNNTWQCTFNCRGNILYLMKIFDFRLSGSWLRNLTTSTSSPSPSPSSPSTAKLWDFLAKVTFYSLQAFCLFCSPSAPSKLCNTFF